MNDLTEQKNAASNVIEIHEVLQRLPHRYPFLLVDRAVEYVPNKSIRGIKNVTINEPFFPGHFPGAPVMPGVLQIEALAQTGALLMSKTLEADITKHLILFMSVENARFKRPVMPGDVMEMPVEVLFQRRNIFKFRGRVEVNGELATDCEFAAMKADRP
ncbi:MAG: 3-hydroxyacyl-ACP dehydratase FabZ [Hyphomonadaceae bacterium]|nr:3-hydroxyacyl-ACP dehydratase FabZ [Hyphomonadaceae bacterium]GIK48119.1 MAG: 3-hydroxyacyl-[acyl-carrier-protein] dehydratase FabZ [Alphaproteobacteria bacterium]